MTPERPPKLGANCVSSCTSGVHVSQRFLKFSRKMGKKDNLRPVKSISKLFLKLSKN